MEKYFALLMLRSKLNLWSTQTELYGGDNKSRSYLRMLGNRKQAKEGAPR